MTAASLQGESDERRLYELIFKRTLASQMSNAVIEKTTVDIHLPGREEMLVAKGEAIQFDGFMKVYLEGTDDEKEDRGMLPRIEQGQALDLEAMQAIERFTKPTARFSEAALGKEARGAADWPPVHLRLHHRHHPETRLRCQGGPRRQGAEVPDPPLAVRWQHSRRGQH